MTFLLEHHLIEVEFHGDLLKNHVVYDPNLLLGNQWAK